MFVSLAFTGFYMPADGVLAAYKRDFGTSRCAIELKTTIVSDAPKRVRNVCFWHKADIAMALTNVRFWG
jgi:hypothetical protein